MNDEKETPMEDNPTRHLTPRTITQKDIDNRIANSPTLQAYLKQMEAEGEDVLGEMWGAIGDCPIWSDEQVIDCLKLWH